MSRNRRERLNKNDRIIGRVQDGNDDDECGYLR